MGTHLVNSPDLLELLAFTAAVSCCLTTPTLYPAPTSLVLNHNVTGLQAASNHHRGSLRTVSRAHQPDAQGQTQLGNYGSEVSAQLLG